MSAEIYTTRQLVATERPDSLVLKRLAKGKFGYEAKIYFDSDKKEATAKMIDKFIALDKSLKMVFPMEDVEVAEEVKYLKSRVAELENELADTPSVDEAMEARAEARAEMAAEARD